MKNEKMELSQHFTLGELCKTKTRLSNEPNEEQINNLKRVCHFVLCNILRTFALYDELLISMHPWLVMSEKVLQAETISSIRIAIRRQSDIYQLGIGDQRWRHQ